MIKLLIKKYVEVGFKFVISNKLKFSIGVLSFVCLINLIAVAVLNCKINKVENNCTIQFVELSQKFDSLENQILILKDEIARLPNKNDPIPTKVIVKGSAKNPLEYSVEELYEKAFNYKRIENDWVRKTLPGAVKRMSEKYNIPIYIIYTLMDTESRFDPNADSHSGAKYGRGLLQVSEVALKDFNEKNEFGLRYCTKDLYNLEYNLEVGCWYYRFVYDKYAKDPVKSTMTWKDLYCAYNVGYKAFEKYREDWNKGYDPIRKIKYNALDNWDNQFKRATSFFFT